MFITVPRRRPGIPSTLNYVDLNLNTCNESPSLRAYPNYTINEIPTNSESNKQRLISVYRTSVDVCNRLWFIDTGMLEYPGK